MARYRCPRCHEITYKPERFAMCGICSAPLSSHNLEPEVPAENHHVVPLATGAAPELRAGA